MSENRQITDAGKTIVVGMSGGVDSSVVAAILKEQGHNVIGLFMKNWEEQDEFGVCQSAKEYADVIKVCDKLKIPYYCVEFVKEYRDHVFSHFLAEYQAGHTPNPDILCNREIKFKVFLEKALALGADYLATGHYCQNQIIAGVHHLVKGVDENKDQTYFLYANKKEILEKVLFPIGHLEKSEVRDIAKKYNLSTQNKKDSTGICFIGERNFRNFLSEYIQMKPGNFENLQGAVVGEHVGAAFYTIGQRRGLGLGGAGERWFVVKKDMQRNIVVVERGERHPALYCDYLTANEITWIGSDRPFNLPYKCQARCRYRQRDQDCIIAEDNGGVLKVEFSVPQRAITPRQSVVFYSGDLCLGGGMIIAPGPNYYEMQKELPDHLAD